MIRKISLLMLATALVIFGCSKKKTAEPDPINVPVTPPPPATSTSVVGYDESFRAPTGFTGNYVALQSDGKYILGGYTRVNNASVFKVYRLNANGGQDNSFNIDVDKTWLIASIAGIHVLADGKILLCGEFTVSGKRAILVRLNPNGALDNSYSHPTVNSSLSTPMLFQRTADGKVLFVTYVKSSTSSDRSPNIYRLNNDGTRDNGFKETNYSLAPTTDGIHSLTPLVNGKILVSGAFSSTNSVNNVFLTRRNVIRLNSDGSIDYSFNFTPTVNYLTTMKRLLVTAQTDGKIIIGGSFNNLTDETVRDASYNYVGLVRLTQEGDIDHSFKSPTKFNFGFYLNDMVLLSDNRILMNWVDVLGGYGHQGKNYLELYSANGGLATDFNFPYQYGVFSSILKESADRFLMTGDISIGNVSYPLIRLVKK